MSSATSPAAQPLRIIVADDQASVREGLVLLLGGLPDIDVVGAAPDGEQAIALVAEHDPDAILLDLHMPVLDGGSRPNTRRSQSSYLPRTSTTRRCSRPCAPAHAAT